MNNPAEGTFVPKGAFAPEGTFVPAGTCGADVSAATDIRQEYLSHLAAKGIAPGTIGNRSLYLDYFFSFLTRQGILDVTEVTPSIVDAYRRYTIQCPNQKTKKPLAPSTINERIWTVKQFFDSLANQGKLFFHPARHIVFRRAPKPIPKTILTEDEMAGLLCRPNAATPHGVRDKAILELMYSAGLRGKEVIRLNVGDIDFYENIVWIRQAKGKKDRVVPLGGEPRRCLEEYLKQRARSLRPSRSGQSRPDPCESALFVGSLRHRLKRSTLVSLIHRHARAAGIDKQVNTHTFRHSCATHMLRGGANIRLIQELLGHRHLATTQIYTHVVPVDLKEAHRRHHPQGKIDKRNNHR